MSKEQVKIIEKIKRAIRSGHQRGVCDKDGNSVLDSAGNMVATPRKVRASKTYVHRNGKMVEKCLDK